MENKKGFIPSAFDWATCCGNNVCCSITSVLAREQGMWEGLCMVISFHAYSGFVNTILKDYQQSGDLCPHKATN